MFRESMLSAGMLPESVPLMFIMGITDSLSRYVTWIPASPVYYGNPCFSLLVCYLNPCLSCSLCESLCPLCWYEVCYQTNRTALISWNLPTLWKNAFYKSFSILNIFKMFCFSCFSVAIAIRRWQLPVQQQNCWPIPACSRSCPRQGRNLATSASS
jgi:ferredoxin